jgi:hypothetical protein
MGREVECVGKGEAHKPYEFGVKVVGGDEALSLEGRPVRHACEGLAGAAPMTATRTSCSPRRLA